MGPILDILKYEVFVYSSLHKNAGSFAVGIIKENIHFLVYLFKNASIFWTIIFGHILAIILFCFGFLSILWLIYSLCIIDAKETKEHKFFFPQEFIRNKL